MDRELNKQYHSSDVGFGAKHFCTFVVQTFWVKALSYCWFIDECYSTPAKRKLNGADMRVEKERTALGGIRTLGSWMMGLF